MSSVSQECFDFTRLETAARDVCFTNILEHQQIQT